MAGTTQSSSPISESTAIISTQPSCRSDASQTLPQCKVCGDAIKRQETPPFKSIACSSCWNFFKRSTFSEPPVRYACRSSRNCPIARKTRNRCQYCRLQKCLLAGMKTTDVKRVGSVHESTAGYQQIPIQPSVTGWMPPPASLYTQFQGSQHQHQQLQQQQQQHVVTTPQMVTPSPASVSSCTGLPHHLNVVQTVPTSTAMLPQIHPYHLGQAQSLLPGPVMVFPQPDPYSAANPLMGPQILSQFAPVPNTGMAGTLFNTEKASDLHRNDSPFSTTQSGSNLATVPEMRLDHQPPSLHSDSGPGSLDHLSSEEEDKFATESNPSFDRDQQFRILSALSHSYPRSDSGLDTSSCGVGSDVSSVFSGQSVGSNSSRVREPELSNYSTSVTSPPPLLDRQAEKECEQLNDQLKEIQKTHCTGPPTESLTAGPDFPMPDLDLDELCQSHRLVHTMPSEKQNTASQVSLSDLISNGKVAFGLLLKWVKGVELFRLIPPTERAFCVKACYIEQMILTIIYRSLILQSEGMVMSSGKEFKAGEVDNALVSYGIGRIMAELMGSFKTLALDHKEFICLRLLFLFNPDAPEVESPVKEHIRRIQDVVLVALEEYCTEQHPTAPLRYSKLLLSMASLRSIGREMTQEAEVRSALASANFDSSQLLKFLEDM